MASMLDDVPGLMALYRLADLKVAYLNHAANERLNPGGRADTSRLTLWETVGLSSHRRLQAEILPQARVLGRWSGPCDFRDVWGGEFAVTALFKLQRLRGDSYLGVYAHESAATEAVNGTRFTDRQLLHALLDHAPDHIYFKDAASRFLRISRSQSEKFGLADPAHAIGRTDFDFFTAEHAGRAFADEQQILKTGEPVIDLEEKETRADGRITWVRTTKLPLYDAAGRLIGTFGLSRDITAHKLAEASRKEMEAQVQLAQKMESIGRLAAGVAHEVNTPTQFIADNARFLQDAFARQRAVLARYRELGALAGQHADCAGAVAAAIAEEERAEIDYLSAEIPRSLEQSLQGLARVARIVCSLKEFAHPNSPHLAPADLNHAIETALVVSRYEWKYVAEVETQLDPALPPVPCVADEFNQVVLNMIINAAHAIGD
ncbi:MAG TPA: PAS domain-containing protein, partial [Opitutus sp.]|nr:PAS domain-containing protein [Opitutus sp.]